MVDNKNINENEENIIPTAEDVRTCADAALVLIRFSANSRKMLEDKLIKKGFSRDVVKIALDNLEKGGFINDKHLLYAHAFRLATVKYYGRYRIKLDLCRKFHKDTVNKYIDGALEDVNFEECAEKLAMKFSSYGMDYVCSKLRRNGYTTQEIRYAVRNIETK
jgi:SOS response regulatory protein OraA/RecX